MQRKIEQLLKGKFEYEVKPPVLSPESIEATVGEKQLHTGAFFIRSAEDKRIRGFLYSSNPRVTFDPPQFYGADNRIMYQVDVSGLTGGETTDGFFTICTELGEYSIPYRFSIKEKAEGKRAGKTDQETGERAAGMSVEQLADLARTDVHAARSIFASPAFREHMEAVDSDAALLLRGVWNPTAVGPALEEFLIGCGRKEPVEISLDTGYIQMDAPERSVSSSVMIRSSNWGFLTIDLSSDSRFIRLEKKQVTTDSFVGGCLPVSYIIDTNFLHAGRNYGRLRVSTCYQTLYLDIVVENGKQGDETSALRVQKLMRKKLLGLYLDLRLKRIEMQNWIDRSLNVLTGYKRSGGTDVFADLFQAQLYFADGKTVRGRKILNQLENTPERFESPQQYAYYLYLTTFFERDKTYVDQVEMRIEQLFLQNRENWIIQWILLYLKERYIKDDVSRMEAIRLQIGYGCSSPIMYLEACQVMRKNPYLLRSLDNVSLRLLRFAAKQKMIGEELAFHIANLALQSPFYEAKLLYVLKACYEQYNSDELLSAVCSCLIAGDRKEKSCFAWYAKAVEEDLRITGLYEYYMETMDMVGIEKMPQIIRMYFAYNQSLGYHKKAAIYRSISDNRDNVPQVYRSSRQSIEQFVLSQLMLDRIDDNLAVLYERFLSRRALTTEGAEHLTKLLFTFEISCRNPKMKSVLVIHQNIRSPQEVRLHDGKARVQIYSDDARVLLCDEKGGRYASSSLYMVRRFLNSQLLLSWCRELSREHPGLVLYYTGLKQPIDAQTLDLYKRAEKMTQLTDGFREQIRSRLMTYYLNHPRQEDLYDYLREIDRGVFLRAGKNELMTLLTREGMYEEAFSMLETYGAEQLDLQVLVRICSQSVLLQEYEENPLLLDYCYRCFQYGKHDDNILTYLLMYYDGPIEDMKRLWNTGRSNDLDTMILEEKILTLLLFTGTGSAGTEMIFASYQSRLGRRKLCHAYLNMKSYEYFVKNLPVADIIFTHLEQMYFNDEEMEDVAKLALLQFYSGLSVLSQNRQKAAQALLSLYNDRGIRFAFFRRFPESLSLSCQLEDKAFLEYVTNPAHEVKLYYRLKGQEDYSCEQMKNCFEGIFVREFILFDGETLECYIEEYNDGILISRSSQRTLTAGEVSGRGQSRYALLCRMNAEAQDTEKLTEDLDNYYQMDYLTRELFTLL